MDRLEDRAFRHPRRARSTPKSHGPNPLRLNFKAGRKPSSVRNPEISFTPRGRQTTAAGVGHRKGILLKRQQTLGQFERRRFGLDADHIGQEDNAELLRGTDGHIGAHTR